MRKYLLNPGILTSIAGILPVIRNSTTSHSKFRTIAAWAAWAGTLTAAIASVREASEEHEAELRQQQSRR
ncbi:hypothetical protein [Gulosibacter bifidus]|uniref:Uncharacterized protein n=1 Tax=Gulosibacter bifidus TaxID=272239 RepID=A0ABW5RJT2_9MICO|nr:hypothetical protein [Gulosibacter bifidus]